MFHNKNVQRSSRLGLQSQLLVWMICNLFLMAMVGYPILGMKFRSTMSSWTYQLSSPSFIRMIEPFWRKWPLSFGGSGSLKFPFRNCVACSHGNLRNPQSPMPRFFSPENKLFKALLGGIFFRDNDGFHNPFIRPAISWGNVALPLDSDKKSRTLKENKKKSIETWPRGHGFSEKNNGLGETAVTFRNFCECLTASWMV